MVERDPLTPVGVVMTPLATVPELPLMGILIPVTGNAGRAQLVAIKVARMA
jgi:hypothetical protein